MGWLWLGLIFAALAGNGCCGMLFQVNMFQEYFDKMEYIGWAVIAYLFFHLLYLQMKYLYPLLEELRQTVRNKEALDPQNVDPEDRGPILSESFWIWVTQALSCIFLFMIVIICNALQETPLGVSTLIGSMILDNFILFGIILLVGKKALYLSSWITLRDGVIVLIALVIFIAFVFFEGSVVIGVFYWICLIIYWLLEGFSKKIGRRLKIYLNRNNNSVFPSIDKLLNHTTRQVINWEVLQKYIPKKPEPEKETDLKNKNQDRAMKKWNFQFESMYMNNRSTAKKMRIIEVKKRLYISIARVCVGIRRLKKAFSDAQKKHRNNIYQIDTRDAKYFFKEETEVNFPNIYMNLVKTKTVVPQ